MIDFCQVMEKYILLKKVNFPHVTLFSLFA